MGASVRVTVDSRVRIDTESIKALPPGAFDAMKELCLHDNPDFTEWLKFGRGARFPPPKKVKSYKKEKGGHSFPRGVAAEIIRLCGADVHVSDRRLTISAPNVKCVGPTPRDYQNEFIEHGLEADKTRAWAAGVWRAPPGSGKTQAIFELIARLGLKTLVIVPTDKIFKQWVTRARKALGVEPGVIKGQKRIVGDLVTIGMQQTLWRCAGEFKEAFGAVIADEAQLFSAKTPREVVDVFPAIFRMAVSGDERRADGRQFFLYSQFGPVALEVTRERVKGAGGIVDVEVVVVPTDFSADWYTSLKADQKFRMRHKMLDEMEQDGKRTALAVSIAKNCFYNDGEQVAVLTNRRDHCERLCAALNSEQPAVILMGDDKAFEGNHKAFASGFAKFAACTYQAVGVGFESHSELARGVFAMPVISNDESRMQFFQFLGRYARPAKGKKRARVYYLLDSKVFGKNPAKLIRKWLGDDLSSVLSGGKLIPISQWLKEKGSEREESSSRKQSFFGF